MARFWVGGTDVWNATAGTKWATTSGGAGGAAIPTATDMVFFDSASGVNTVTLSASSVALGVDTTGFTGNITHPAATVGTIGGSTPGTGNVALKLVTGMTYTLGNNGTSGWLFNATTGTQQTVDFANKIPALATFNGVGGSWIMSSDFLATTTGGSGIDLVAGTLNLNGKTITGNGFRLTGALARSLVMGAASVTTSSNAGGLGLWTATVTTNLTFDAGTSTITINGGDNNSFNGGGLTYNNVVIQNARIGFAGANTFASLTMSGNGNNSRISLQANQIATTLSMFGVNNNNSRLLITGSDGNSGIQFGGPARTITAATVTNLTNVDFADIIAAGASIPWSGTSVGDMGNNTGITFTPAVTRYWVAPTGGLWSATTSWSASSGGSSGASVPLCHDTVIVDANSITSTGRTINMDVGRPGKDIDFSAVLNSPTIAGPGGSTTTYLCGSWIWANNMTVSASMLSIYMLGRSNHNFTTNGTTLPCGLTVSTGTGVYTFTDNVNCTNSFNMEGGNAIVQGDVTATVLFAGRNVTRSLDMGSGLWTLTTANAGNIVDMSNGSIMTLSAANTRIVVSSASSNTRNFVIGVPNAVFGSLSVIVAGSVGQFGINGTTTLTIKRFHFSDASNARTLQFTNAKTYIFEEWDVFGLSGKLITISTNTNGQRATLSKPGGVAASEYLAVKDISGTGGAYWAMGATSTDNGNNLGLQFVSPKYTKPRQMAVVN